MAKVLPPPPAFLAKIELKGPYDKDIPAPFVGQLRGASLASDWAIPYIFMSIGLHFESLGDETRTLHFYDQSLAEFKARKNFKGEGSAFNRKVFALYAFGRMGEAFDAIRQKEQEWPTAPLSAFVSHNYGHYYLMNGDYAKALSYFQQAGSLNKDFQGDFDLLMLRRDGALESGIAAILAEYVPRMSRKYNLLDFDPDTLAAIRGRLDEATAQLRRVLELNNAVRRTKQGGFAPAGVWRVMETNVCNFLGLAAGIKGDWPEAFSFLEKSSRLARQEGYRIGEVDSLFFLNQVYLLKKDITAGLKAAQELNELADRYRFPFYQVWAKFILSRYRTGFGDTPGAIVVLKEAVAVVESQRAGLVIDELKETYIFNRQVVYEALVDLLAREGDFASALDFAERSKARLLVDLLAGKDISRSPAQGDLLRQERQAGQEVTQLGKRLAMVQGEQGARALLAGLAKAEGSYRDIVVNIKRADPELAALVSVQSSSPSAIQALLPEDTALVDYFVADQDLYIWAVDRDKVHMERVKISRERLRELAQAFLQALTARDKAKSGALSQQLYDSLLKPMMPFVAAPKIGIVAHDVLYYVPFAALSDKGEYLVESRSLFSLPSAATLEHLPARPAADKLRVLAFGNPDLGSRELDLAFAEAEVASIKKRFAAAAVFTGKEATKKRAQEMLPGEFDVAHFATHGEYLAAAPLQSGLVLAPSDQDDGRLSALDIFRLRFKGSAAILSACQTALGRSSTGSEIVGLNRSFLYAGAPAVVATLWSIDDQATAAFMDYFYAGLEKKLGLAASLRAAQLNMIRQGRPPYYWAAFVLTGRG